MNKYTEYLEQYVEWVGIGLGALFVLAMVYGFVLQSPVVVPIKAARDVASKDVAPGEVPKMIADGPVRDLEAAINNVRPPEMKVRPFVPEFVDAMRWNKQNVSLLLPPWINSPGLVGEAGSTTPDGVKPAKGPMVVKLPVPPKAKYVGTSSGRSVVQIPDPKGKVDPTNPNAQPVIMDDRNWVTQVFSVPMAELAKAMEEAQIPAFLWGQTLFLQVELVRQEQSADGTWGNESTVKPLAIHQLPPFPGASKGAQLEFVDWASKNTVEIIAPSFYVQVRGDHWWLGGQPNPNEAAIKAVLDQKKEEEARRREQEERDRAAKQPPRAPKTPPANKRNPGGVPPMLPPPGMPRGMMPVVPDPDRPVTLAQARNPRGNNPPAAQGPSAEDIRRMQAEGERAAREAMRNMGVPMGPGGPPMGPDGVPPMPYSPNGAGGPDTANFAGPNGAFDPSRTPDVTVWAHDDTVQPGVTYRYKLRYKLKSPVFLSSNITNPQTLADQFALQSLDSEWTPSVSVESMTRFWISSGISPSGTVRFDVFKWKDGGWKPRTVTVAPGDMIDETAWTLVDLRGSLGQEPHAILADQSGSLFSRDFKTDQADPDYKKLRDLVAGAKTAAAVPPGQ